MELSREHMVGRMLASDAAYNGRFTVGVLTTGIYCLPSCRARKPKPENVRFFATPEDARTAGLRACKRCRPDDFEAGTDADEQALETAMAAVRADPAAFPHVSDVAARLGWGASKLAEQCRRCYHSSPAALLNRARLAAACHALLETDDGVTDVAFAAGYETLSAFYDNFGRAMGMTPTSYRALRCAQGFHVVLPSNYPLRFWHMHMERDAACGTARFDGDNVTMAMLLDGVPVLLRVEAHEGCLHAAMEAEGPLPPGAAAIAYHRLARTLGLGQDPRAFETLCAADAELAPLTAGREGLRVPQTATVFEGLVWSILGQQITVTFATELRRRLTALAGTPIGGHFAPPTPEVVANLNVDDLTPLQFPRRKAEYLIDAASLVASGDLLVEAMPDMAATRAERLLLAVRGIGPWSAHYVLMRACGFANGVPLGDTGLTMALWRFFQLAERPNRDETARLMLRFAPHQSLATYHLWRTLKETA